MTNAAGLYGRVIKCFLYRCPPEFDEALALDPFLELWKIFPFPFELADLLFIVLDYHDIINFNL